MAQNILYISFSFFFFLLIFLRLYSIFNLEKRWVIEWDPEIGAVFIGPLIALLLKWWWDPPRASRSTTAHILDRDLFVSHEFLGSRDSRRAITTQQLCLRGTFSMGEISPRNTIVKEWLTLNLTHMWMGLIELPPKPSPFVPTCYYYPPPILSYFFFRKIYNLIVVLEIDNVVT